MRLLASLFLLTTGLVAAQQPQIPLSHEKHTTEPHRIAIIGGGAGGASTAYHLKQFAEASEYDVPLDITLFEKESRIGGRTTTVNALNDSAFPVELGGSIFVKINHILYNATRDFGLDIKSRAFESRPDSDYDLGVWDGKQFVFKQSSSDGRWQGYWDIAKLLWKYGLAPIRTRNLVSTVIGKFLRFYEEPLFPFSSLQGVIEEAELLEHLSVSGKEMLDAYGAGGAFGNDIVQASTRVNYAQNLDQIHGLETLVCMSTDGAMAVEGGNWQIFDEAVKRSGAKARLNTTVLEVRKDTAGSNPTYSLTLSNGSSSGPYDAVVLAAPYQFANISFEPALTHKPFPVDYVSLHVTLFTSPHVLSPTFFDLPADSPASVPSTILTTLQTSSDATAGESLTFYSISSLRTLHPSQSHHANVTSPQHLYKIFSSAPLKASFLSRLLSFPHTSPVYEVDEDPISAISHSDISWSLEKVWHSYPYEVPRTEFEHIRLDGEEVGHGRGVWYTSGIESFISTMETSALMGKNVAALIVQELADGFEY
ncbi:uncharacterized protein HMPREF1541_10660 [Cyphellophora europaea CBS 101466]|uniref:Prenylcysteine lyase domain-containing protein n=1 Tax=Cyphellophora europaea (strain CBS 101466) TaxID=1220924 RepID=W2S662_CYPE1|nr:uncharacterized protein HMPREF1541_10660 [Cyphellophora europaea CBS 101466]ETN44110.1 hypothetical protein HMPREF1541_10660 [Cyphellophora europaea CBS 101466]